MPCPFQRCQNSLIRQVTEVLNKRRYGLNYLLLSTGFPDPPHILGWRRRPRRQRGGGKKKTRGKKKAKPSCQSPPVRAGAPSLHSRSKEVKPLGVSPAPGFALLRPPGPPGSTSTIGKDTLHVRHDLPSSRGGEAREGPVTLGRGAGAPAGRGARVARECGRRRSFPASGVPSPLPVSALNPWWVESREPERRDWDDAKMAAVSASVRKGSGRLGAMELREPKLRSLPLRCFTCAQDNTALNLVRHPTSLLVLSFVNRDSA